MPNAAVENLLSCFDSTAALLRELRDEEWAAQSLCPEWTVQGVVAHLAGIEELLIEWAPGPDPFFDGAKLAAFAAAADGWSPADVLERFEAAIARRRAQITALAPADLEAPCWTPVGPGNYGRVMGVRVFDFWVHEQDMRVPLGRPGQAQGPSAEMALEEVRGSFGYIAGKKVGVPDGKSVTVNLTGPVVSTISAKVIDGRAKVVTDVTDPDASISTDSLTFMLLACGRIDPEAQLAAGKVTLSGDPDLAHRLATQLRFTF